MNKMNLRMGYDRFYKDKFFDEFFVCLTSIFLFYMHFRIFEAVKVAVIIPSRFASTRFPGKPLVVIDGKTMIRRVWEQASAAKIPQLICVATDDDRIEAEVLSFGGICIRTGTYHPSGTDRCREALSKLPYRPDIVINVQGDEPFIHPEQIDLLASAFSSGETDIATLIRENNSERDYHSTSVIKVVVCKNNSALYFSRSPIPCYRDKKFTEFYQHIGLYAYRSDILEKISELPKSALEEIESLEQLRWLENGFSIQTVLTEHESHSIDRPEDLKRYV
jgi:3-deoxy-manno-octulosonate cytidylyltransferase (CMP-KDO synthetase)